MQHDLVVKATDRIGPNRVANPFVYGQVLAAAAACARPMRPLTVITVYGRGCTVMTVRKWPATAVTEIGAGVFTIMILYNYGSILL